MIHSFGTIEYGRFSTLTTCQMLRNALCLSLDIRTLHRKGADVYYWHKAYISNKIEWYNCKKLCVRVWMGFTDERIMAIF